MSSLFLKIKVIKLKLNYTIIPKNQPKRENILLQNLETTALSDGTKLCLECGLCCTGVFHSKAVIYSLEDRECAKSFDADIFFQDNTEYFKLPCPIYEGKCPIYPCNPSVCQKHQCDLLKSIHNGEIKLEKASTVVQEMKQIIYNIEHDSHFPPCKTDNRDISLTFHHFFTSTSKKERKKFSILLQKYATFCYLMKKYFYA